MGRGRAKAKQQKVARELKYNSHYTDLDALQRELSGANGAEETPEKKTAHDPDEDDYYDDWARSSR